MGLTKQYLRYTPSIVSPFGVVSSPNGQAVFVQFNSTSRGGQEERFVATAACEDIIIWDCKTGEKVKTLSYRDVSDTENTNSFLNESSEVVVLRFNSRNLLAAGHFNGVIRVWDINTDEVKVTLTGHKSSVTCLAFDDEGLRLVSGGKDTEVVLWDLVSQTGMFRLRGHKDIVTQVTFLSRLQDTSQDIVISGSRDTFVKFWDLKTQHCFKTLIGHKSEVWDFVFLSSKNWLITGSGDSELRVWKIAFEREDRGDGDDEAVNDDILQEDGISDESFLSVKKVGSFLRQSLTPVRSLCLDPEENYIVCHGKDNLIEAFKVRSPDEVKTFLNKRVKKEKKRALKQDQPKESLTETEVTLTDEVESLSPLTASSKVKYVDVISRGNGFKAFISVTLTCNAIEIYGYSSGFEKKQGSDVNGFHEISCLKNEGHRTDIRVIAFSSDNYFIMTASADCIKVWSRVLGRCVVTLDCYSRHSYSLCGMFAPGDKNVIIGTKEGTLSIYDVSDAKHLESIQASDEGEAVWSIDMYPNGKGMVSGSEDKTVRFWDFDLVAGETEEEGVTPGPRRLTLKMTRQLKLEEGVISLKISPNSKLIAVSLLDSTVKVFFFDSLKFFLNLYGHKFPALTIDISYDSTLIATGSADKNIKIWGLDFGDCHKSIFAHEEPITTVKFVSKTHYMFSAAKDGIVRQWDTDSFQKIVTLKGHHSEIWALNVSPNGKFIASCSHDRSIRVWGKTSEPLVLEEQQELEMEEEEERLEMTKESMDTVVGDTNRETGLAGKKTVLTLKGTDLIMEAIDIHRQELLGKRNNPDHEPHLLLSRYKTTCPDRFVLETIRSIKSSDFDECLISLPFHSARDLLIICRRFLDKDWELELVMRVVLFLTRIHFSQISSTSELSPVIEKLATVSLQRSKEVKDLASFNLAALRFLQDKINERQEISLFKEAFDRLQDKKKNKKSSNKKNKPDSNLSSTSAPVLKLT